MLATGKKSWKHHAYVYVHMVTVIYYCRESMLKKLFYDGRMTLFDSTTHLLCIARYVKYTRIWARGNLFLDIFFMVVVNELEHKIKENLPFSQHKLYMILFTKI